MQAPTATEPLDSLLVPVPEEKVKEVLEVVQARLCAHLHAGASLLYIGDAIDPELYVFETGAGVVEPPIPTKFSIGEGFLGQVVKEKRPLSERVSTQMLGHSVSTALLQNTEIFISAIPLLYQEQVEGVWCIASEGDILSTLAEPTWQDFLYKWAAYLQTLRSRRYIQSLLEKTQIQNQELITREEELRQNLEELAVTQEEMRRAQQLLSKQRDSQNFIIDLFTLMAAAVPHNLRSISRIFLAQLSQYFHGEGAALLYHTDKGWHTLFSWSSKRAGISFPTQWNIPSAILEGLERSRQAGCYSAADLGIEGDKNYWLVIPYFTPTGLSGMTLMAFSEPFAMTSYDAKNFLHISVAYFTAYERVSATITSTHQSIQALARVSQAQTSVVDISTPLESLPWLTEIPLVQRETYLTSLQEAIQKETPVWIPPEEVAIKEMIVISANTLQRMKWS